MNIYIRAIYPEFGTENVLEGTLVWFWAKVLGPRIQRSDCCYGVTALFWHSVDNATVCC